MKNDLKRNGSGCLDPTAYQAIMNADAVSSVDKANRYKRKKAMHVGTLATATVAAAYYVSKHPDKFSKVLKAVEKESVKNFSRKTIDSGKKYVKKCVKESANGIKDGITEGVKEAPKKAVKTVITGVTLNAAKKYLDSIVGEEESARIFRANDNKQIGKFWKTSLEDIVK